MSKGTTEIRKGAVLIAASMLAAQKIAFWDGKSSPVLEIAIADAIAMAEKRT